MTATYEPLVPWEGMTEADAAAMIAEHQRRLDEAYANRERPAGHVLLPPKSKPGRMSGPRYFNLMRAIESNPDQYADYRPTTLCGAARTVEDVDLRSAKAKTNRAALASWGLCPDCIHLIEERFPL